MWDSLHCKTCRIFPREKKEVYNIWGKKKRKKKFQTSVMLMASIHFFFFKREEHNFPFSGPS